MSAYISIYCSARVWSRLYFPQFCLWNIVLVIRAGIFRCLWSRWISYACLFALYMKFVIKLQMKLCIYHKKFKNEKLLRLKFCCNITTIRVNLFSSHKKSARRQKTDSQSLIHFLKSKKLKRFFVVEVIECETWPELMSSFCT